MISHMIKNQSGQAMVAAIVTAGSVVGAAYYMLRADPNSRLLKISNARYSAQMVKENLISILDNDAAWMKTIDMNPKLQCLKTPGAVCSPSDFGTINIYDADGSLVDNALPNIGYDYSGKICDRYDVNNPDLNCVFQYGVKWECSGPCEPTTFGTASAVALTPRIRLVANFQFASKDQSLKHQLPSQNKAFTFDFVRAARAKTLSQYCNSVEGIFDQRHGSCKSSMSPPNYFDCTTVNPHSWFVGFQPNGTPICKADAKLGQMCPNGTAVIGYQQDGRIICGPF